MSARPTSAASTSRSTRPAGSLAFAAIDNLWKGASGQAIQNLNLMLGLDETEGLVTAATGTFFRSRWVEAPAGVEELDPRDAGARASGPAGVPAA